MRRITIRQASRRAPAPRRRSRGRRPRRGRPGAFGGGELLAGVAVPVGQGGGVDQTALGHAGDLQHLAGVPSSARRSRSAARRRRLSAESSLPSSWAASSSSGTSADSPRRGRARRASTDPAVHRAQARREPLQRVASAVEVDQPLRRSGGIQRVDLAPDVGRLAQQSRAGLRTVVAVELDGQGGRPSRGERPRTSATNRLARLVVRLADATSRSRARRRLPRRGPALPSAVEAARRARAPAAGRARRGDHARHPQVALERRPSRPAQPGVGSRRPGTAGREVEQHRSRPGRAGLAPT